MSIYMRIDAECNETTPEIAVDRCPKYFNILTKMTPNSSQKKESGQVVNVEIEKNEGQIWNHF